MQKLQVIVDIAKMKIDEMMKGTDISVGDIVKEYLMAKNLSGMEKPV
jgi:hypothetical protein